MINENRSILNLDLDLLRTFVAVADLSTFAAAAVAVRRTQSAVSQQMQRLEQLVGKELFARHGRNKLLTEQGIQLKSFDSKAIKSLQERAWRGNIRELRNAADCHALGIGRDAATAGVGSTPQSLNEAVENYERVLIANEFTKQDGNIARTADALKVARTTLHDKLKKYALI